MVAEPEVARTEAKENGRDHDGGRCHAELDRAVGEQGPMEPVGEATGGGGAEGETRHERREHGGDGVHRHRERQRQQPHPHHLVDEPARPGQEEEDEEQGRGHDA